MLGMTGGGFPGEEEDDSRTWKEKAFRGRRLKQALFLSGIFLLSSVSVYALSPKETGPSGRLPMASVNRDASDGRREACVLYMERELLTSFGAGTRNDSDRESSEFDRCGEILAEEDFFRGEEADTLEAEIGTLVSGYPIENMAPFSAKYDREVAGLIVGIAKKESDWGLHVPTRDGQDCYNYWGYKGVGSRGTSIGYGCFGTPEEAVKAVGDRLTELVSQRQASSPEKLVVWKCGSSCAGDSPENVRKWISDVRVYYDRLATKS